MHDLTDLNKLLRIYPTKKNDWDNTFLAITYLLSVMSHCSARQTGALIVDVNGCISASGINGTKPGEVNCDEIFPPKPLMTPEQRLEHKEFQKLHELHAEENAIKRAKKSKCDMKGATIYTLCKPCYGCMDKILTTPISRVVYSETQKTPNGASGDKYDGLYSPEVELEIAKRKIEFIQKDIDWAVFSLYMQKISSL